MFRHARSLNQHDNGLDQRYILRIHMQTMHFCQSRTTRKVMKRVRMLHVVMGSLLNGYVQIKCNISATPKVSYYLEGMGLPKLR